MTQISPKNLKSLPEKDNIITSIINGRSCQYLDIPRYPNIGDHLIAHGCFHFFDSSGIKLSRACDIFSYQKKWLRDTEIIIFSGGGNFGTLWPDIHKRRLLLAREALALGKTVIILPQSIYYENTMQLEEDKKIFRHPHLYFFARDSYSYNIGRDIFNNIYLAPDMAHQLYKLFNTCTNNRPQGDSKLYFMRNDKEAAKERFKTIATNDTILDWDDILKFENCAILFNLYNFLYKHLKYFQFDKKSSYWRLSSWKIVETAAKLFLTYDTVITDRLHGMIFSLLLHRNVHMIDNENHKLSNYAKTWLLD